MNTDKVSSKNKSKAKNDLKEGGLTKTVETYTAKLPSMTWLMLAAGSGVLSADLAMMREKKVDSSIT